MSEGETRGATTLEEMLEIFSDIYRENSWGESASVSGPGSTVARAADFIDELVELVRSLGVKTLLDAPCGDGQWVGPVAEAVGSYIGFDIVPELIESLQRSKSEARRRFLVGDLTRDALPKVDVILCRDGLVHFSFRDIARALRNFKRSGSRYLLTTTFLDRETNADIATGAWRPLNLEAAPFDFPEPLASVDEKCRHSDGIYRDKRLALWSLADLPEPAF